MSEKEKSNKFSEGGGKPFGKIWKKWWFWALIVAVLIGGVIEFTEPKTEEPTTATVEPTTEPTATSEPEKEKTDQTEEPTITEEPATTEEPTITEEPAEHREGMYGISDKNIEDVDAHFSVSDVRNDVTGNWKISSIAESINIEEYALSYYKKYFSADTEIHAIVNFTLNTTTKISVMGDMIDVSIYEYVDKEEHDAKILFSGTLLKEYFIYLDNGDIEEIQ